MCLPPEIRSVEYLKLTGYMVGSLFIRGHSAGSYAGMLWESIFSEFPDIEGQTVLAAIAMPPSLLAQYRLFHHRKVPLIHHADDRFSEESQAMLVLWPWRFPMCRGNGAELKQLHGTADDLCLQLMGIGHSKYTAPGVGSDWEHGYMQ